MAAKRDAGRKSGRSKGKKTVSSKRAADKKKPARRAPKASTPKRSDVIEQRLEHFGEELGALGDRFGKRVDQKGEEWDSWFHRTFGLVGPLISSIFGIIMVGLLIWALRFMNAFIGVTFLSSIEVFLFTNMSLF
ncbi:MAG: hypothetical protein KAT35_02040, partial [Candidatus Aenigmarchaeota archaeon]|nr:hypothetical protein [Candidatus Aenigmarchaeota archaeon]